MLTTRSIPQIALRVPGTISQIALRATHIVSRRARLACVHASKLATSAKCPHHSNRCHDDAHRGAPCFLRWRGWSGGAARDRTRLFGVEDREDGRHCLPGGPSFLSLHLPAARRLLPEDTLLLPLPDAPPASCTTRMLVWMLCQTDAALRCYPLPSAVCAALLAPRRVVLWRREILSICAAPAPSAGPPWPPGWRDRCDSGRRLPAAASYRS